MFTCNFCSTVFTTNTALVAHQKTAKYCLVKQGLPVPKNPVCEFCERSYSTPARLRSHQEQCATKRKLEKIEDPRNNIDYTVEMYEMRLKHLEEKLNDKDAEISLLREQLERRIDDITDIACQTKLSSQEEEENDEVPLTVSEQLENMEDSSYMMTLSKLTVNNVTILSRHPDHYVNATQLCQAGGKKFNDWYRLDTTKDLITVLSSDTGIPVSLLVEAKKGQTSIFQQGSWIHPDLAIQLAQWISAAFAIQIGRWIRSLFNDGKVAIDLSLMKEQQKRIELLETICLSKRKREKYEGQFFVYLLTTDDHLKRRTYIVGKAKNLEHRLGTYNKTCDHTVVYYRECDSEDNMNLIENLVLNRLNGYREQSNRDRFVLPEDKDITFFQTAIDSCVQFVCG